MLVKSEKIVLNGKEIEIKELKVKNVINLVKELDGKDLNLETINEIADKFLPEISNIKKEDILELSFGEIEALENLFWKVNASFLKQLDRLGISAKIKNILKNLTGPTVE